MEFDDSLSTSMGDFGESTQDLEIPESLPMMAVRDVVVFNYMIIPLFVGRPGSIEAVNEGLSKNKLLMLVTQKDPTKDDPEEKDLYSVGMVSMIMRTLKLPDGRLKVLVQAISKARVRSFQQQKPFYRVEIDLIDEPEAGEITVETEALMRTVREQTEKIMSLRGLLSSDLMMIINNIEEPGRLADLVGSNLRLKIAESQKILETIDPTERLRLVADLLHKELEVSTVQAKIQSDAKEEMSRSQREYFLREQIQALKRELGDEDGYSQEIEDLRKQLRRKKMPKYAKKEAKKQLKRLEMMHPDASEATIVRTYLDWFIDLPWKESSTDLLDLKVAADILDEDHYGLDRIKERILEYLAVRKLNENTKGPIICFVGPPGVGKTSLGQAIAKAMGRKFYRLSLGGMRDEAEIRGHRRTYIGALPGRIIESLKRAGTNNPVFLLDEIDKLGNDFRGDPSSALLEVLDPEQNATFTDHYLDIEFDLSKVMFIATANVLDTIPGPLRDRMEVVELSGYTQQEKVAIASRHLIAKQLEAHALTADDLEIPEATIEALISSYTREAGVRNLERELAALCRGTAARIARGETGKTVVTPDKLYDFLGPQRFFPETKARSWGPGLATGLAWTPVGGQILFIETSSMKGKGGLMLTGKLGEVMKESATAALTYIKSHARELDIDEELFAAIDLHVHVPEGAIPKDGPSAGVAMVSSLASMILGRPVRQDVAMTGEITLRGDVLPVGGIGEKVLAALRAGIRELVLPPLNEKDVLEIPEDIRAGVIFHYPHTIREALAIVMDKTGANS